MKNRIKTRINLMILVAAFFGVGASAQAADITDGLVAHWNFDDCQANDSSGNDYHGIIHGNPQCVQGMVNKALQFNGISDYIEIADSPGLNTGNLTFVAWVNPLDLLNSENTILNKENQYEFAIFGNHVYDRASPYELAFAFNPDWHWFNANHYKPATGKYIQLAITFNDHNRGKIYVNGILKNNIAYNTPIQASANCLRIGARNCPDQATSLFNGIIDDVRLYNRALTSIEIKTLYFNVVPAVVKGSVPWVKPPYALTCQNKTTNKTVSIPFKEYQRYNCEKRGIATHSGDEISVTMTGVNASPSSVIGRVNWIKPPYSVTCQNNTTQAAPTLIPLNKTYTYNCEKAGLAVNSGDEISVTVTGTKY